MYCLACVGFDVFGLWPYHLYGLIRCTVCGADDQADDRWSARDWERAARQERSENEGPFGMDALVIGEQRQGGRGSRHGQEQGCCQVQFVGLFVRGPTAALHQPARRLRPHPRHRCGRPAAQALRQ
ncbi:hypothetical protein AB0F03_37140 [Streptomyces sp. NPDC028722]|uniref:hypothetical protein n=1 Tax=Streptomyces sp. NPDC028722 TaxID=3155016 RepID=UPI0033E0A507